MDFGRLQSIEANQSPQMMDHSDNEIDILIESSAQHIVANDESTNYGARHYAVWINAPYHEDKSVAVEVSWARKAVVLAPNDAIHNSHFCFAMYCRLRLHLRDLALQVPLRLGRGGSVLEWRDDTFWTIYAPGMVDLHA